MCNHGQTASTCSICISGPTADDGYHGPITEPDYAFEARKHDVTTKRTAKGATSQRVTRFGAASVIGRPDVDSCERPLLAMPDDISEVPTTVAARLIVSRLERGEIRRHRYGLSGIDLAKLTDSAYMGLIPPLLGSEVKAYQEQIDTGFYGEPLPVEDRLGVLDPSACRVAQHADGLSGWLSDATLDRFAQQEAVYGADTGTSLSWDGTEIGPAYLRASERTADRTEIIDGQTFKVTELAGRATDEDHVWVGHKLRERGPLAPKAVSQAKKDSKARTEARTITDEPVTAPSTLEGWRELVAILKRGERLVAVDDDGLTFTLTSAASDGRLSAVTPYGRWQTRTVDAMAIRLAS